MKTIIVKRVALTLVAISMILFSGCKPKVQNSWQQDKTTGKWGYHGNKGELVGPYKYDTVNYVYLGTSGNRVSTVRVGGLWGIVSTDDGTLLSTKNVGD